MSVFKWSDYYSVNIKEMDEQHKKLIEITNNLFYAKEEDEQKNVIDHILEDLLDYTETHFTREEELLKQYEYPGYSVQKSMHDHLIKQLLEMHKKYVEGDTSIDNKLALFLRHWLIDHIAEEDKKYGEYINSKGVT